MCLVSGKARRESQAALSRRTEDTDGCDVSDGIQSWFPVGATNVVSTPEEILS